MFRCVRCDEFVPDDEIIRPGDGSWRHGDCPGMGTFPSLTKLRADFDAADEALDAVQRQAREVREQLQKKLEELGDE